MLRWACRAVRWKSDSVPDVDWGRHAEWDRMSALPVLADWEVLGGLGSLWLGLEDWDCRSAPSVPSLSGWDWGTGTGRAPSAGRERGRLEASGGPAEQ